MNKKPIIIIAGEPYSIFFEILFKVYKSNFLNKFKFPLIVIGSEQIIKKQMKKMGYNLIINIIKEKEILSSKIYKNKINLIDVDFKEKKNF